VYPLVAGSAGRRGRRVLTICTAPLLAMSILQVEGGLPLDPAAATAPARVADSQFPSRKEADLRRLYAVDALYVVRPSGLFGSLRGTGVVDGPAPQKALPVVYGLVTDTGAAVFSHARNIYKGQRIALVTIEVDGESRETRRIQVGPGLLLPCWGPSVLLSAPPHQLRACRCLPACLP
jgi:hypothetical protein